MIRSLIIPTLLSIACLSCREMRNADGEPGSKRPSPLTSTEKTIGQDTHIKIIYSSPGVKERVIWGKLVPYNKIWRTGANDATIFETSSDLTIEGTKLKRGKYSLFTIPSEDNWTIIINKVWDQWGAYNYDVSKDAVRLNVAPTKMDSLVERMRFDIETDGIISFKWEYLSFEFLVEPN